jgi:hypothetical protein
MTTSAKRPLTGKAVAFNPDVGLVSEMPEPWALAQKSGASAICEMVHRQEPFSLLMFEWRRLARLAGLEATHDMQLN